MRSRRAGFPRKRGCKEKKCKRKASDPVDRLGGIKCVGHREVLELKISDVV